VLLPAYAYDVNVLGDNIGTIKQNTGTLIDASKWSHQNAGQNYDIKIATVWE
jgi:hypothetical protein